MATKESSVVQLEEGKPSLSSTGSDRASEPYTVFTTFQQIRFLTICALTGMISPLTASIYVPALNQIEKV